MEDNYAKISFVELSPDILIPFEWPIGRISDVVLKSAKEIIMQNDYEDPILRVNGISARLHRYFKQNRFYHVFEKIAEE